MFKILKIKQHIVQNNQNLHKNRYTGIKADKEARIVRNKKDAVVAESMCRPTLESFSARAPKQLAYAGPCAPLYFF